MRRMFWRHVALFAALAVAAGGVFWAGTAEADWWAYVDDAERGPWPKFKFGWPEQLVVSTAVGAVVAAPPALVIAAVQWAWSGRRTK